MQTMDINELTFDYEDRNLFEIDDLLLKAEAIQHAILPKLEGIMNYALSAITDAYEIDSLKDSTVIRYPAFRTKRASHLKTDYKDAEVGLGGKRSSILWKHARKLDDQQPLILPFTLAFQLSNRGLCVSFQTDKYSITLKNSGIYAEVFVKNEDAINILCNSAKMYLSQRYVHDKEHYDSQFIGLKNFMKWQLEAGCFSLEYSTEPIKYPITGSDIVGLIERFVIFYPIYESCLLISKGEGTKLKERIQKLRSSPFKVNIGLPPELEVQNQIALSNLAETKLRVMPALRWQVFQRDQWKCVSCGRNSHDGIILHIDHIVPRSKGGKNQISNYQTLCHICNIGKSNKDQTNLRKQQ